MPRLVSNIRSVVLDEHNTHLVFDGQGVADFKVTILVPKQYDVGTEFWFDGAQNSAASYSSNNVVANTYWTSDASIDPCNVVYTGLFPVR